MGISHVPRWRRLIRQRRLFTATARYSLQATSTLALIAALPPSLTFVRNDKSITTLNYAFPKFNATSYVVIARGPLRAALIVLCLYICISYKIFHIFVYKSYKP